MELEHFHISTFYFIYEIPNSHVKWTGLKFHMWNLGVRNMHFTYEMEHSHTKFYFTYGIETINIWNIIFICEIACEMFVRVGSWTKSTFLKLSLRRYKNDRPLLWQGIPNLFFSTIMMFMLFETYLHELALSCLIFFCSFSFAFFVHLELTNVVIVVQQPYVRKSQIVCRKFQILNSVGL